MLPSMRSSGEAIADDPATARRGYRKGDALALRLRGEPLADTGEQRIHVELDRIEHAAPTLELGEVEGRCEEAEQALAGRPDGFHVVGVAIIAERAIGLRAASAPAKPMMWLRACGCRG